MKILNEIKANKNFLMYAFFSLAIVFFFSYARHNKDDFFKIPYYTWVSFAVYTFILVLWLFSLKARIIDEDIRKNAMFIASLLILFVLIRSIKWEISASPSIEQFFWYLYYIPIILVLYFISIMIFSTNKKIYEKYIKLIRIMGIISLVLILFVLSNSYHYQVFEIIEWADTYDVVERRWGFYLIYVWMFGNFILVNILLIINSKLKYTGYRILVPLIVATIYIIYGIFYNLDPSFSHWGAVEFTVMFCLVAVSLIESLIQVGLIASNQDYIGTFKMANLNIIIVDKAYDLLTSTAIGIGLKKGVYEGMEDGDSLDLGDNRLSIKEIDDGYVLWLDDVTDMNKSIKKIKMANEQMKLKNELLKEEIKLRKTEISAREKSVIYDEINLLVSSRRSEINEIIEGMNDENERYSLIKISLIGAYIKRVSNMILLEKMYGYINAVELENAIIESLLNYGISNKTECKNKFLEFKMEGGIARSIYTCFSKDLEEYFDKNIDISVSWYILNGDFVLDFEYITDCEALNIVCNCENKWKDLGLRVDVKENKTQKNLTIYIEEMELSYV